MLCAFCIYFYFVRLLHSRGVGKKRKNKPTRWERFANFPDYWHSCKLFLGFLTSILIESDEWTLQMIPEEPSAMKLVIRLFFVDETL